jgi:copper chaperone CopZ
MRRSIFWVSNIHCASCVAYVNEVLSEIPTVQKIEVAILKHELRVSHGISVQSEDLVAALIQAAFEVHHVTTYDDRGAIVSELDTTSWNNIKEGLHNSREKRHIAHCDACQKEEAQQSSRDSTREPDLATSSAMSKVQQLFVAPLAFRPNTVFVGMQAELETLHSRLFQSKDQGYDNKSVLISGIPGSGKTHLARQYVFTYRESYPGGIFWVRSSSYESACDGFKQIAQAAGLLGFTEAEDSENSEAQRSQCVSVVLEWLATRENWLLVFDGIELEEDDDDARINFKRLIPRSPKGRIIYTSTDGTGPLLPQPYCIWLGPLQVEDACKLLYQTLGIDTPTEEQVRRATALVERCECLPLAIHALGRQIKAQGTSIETFDLNEKTDRLGIGVFHSIVNEMYRLQKRQALNLLHLLSFLDCHTPVRLIEFGCDALTAADCADILTSPRAGEAPDLGTTIATLLTYALVERTNDTELPRSSPYSERNLPQFSESVLAIASGNADLEGLDGLLSIKREISGLDVLRTHDVVQNFCREDVRLKDISQLEELQQKGTIGKDQVAFYDTWLILTSRFLIKSYDTAQKTSDTLQGRPLGLCDLREYATHIANLTQLFVERNRRSSEPTPWYISDAQLSLRDLSKNIRLELELLRIAPSLNPTGRQVSIFEKLPTPSSGTSAPRDDFDAIDFVMTERSVEGHVRSFMEHELDVTIGSESQYVSDRVFSAGPHSTLDTQTAPTAPTVPTSADPETDDSRTVYSDTLTMDGSIKEAYVNELAHELFKAVSTFRLDSTSMRRVANAMPGCLKAFSSRLGCTTSSEQIQRDVTVFIHKYRQ